MLHLTSADTIAVAKAIGDKATKAARADLAVGVHHVDVTVRVHGALTVGADTDKAGTARMLTKATVALLLRRMGATGDAALAALRDVIAESVALDESAEAALLAQTGVGDALARVEAELVSALPRIAVSGAVRAALAVERVSDEAPALVVAAK